MTVTTGSASDVGVRVNRAGDRDPRDIEIARIDEMISRSNIVKLSDGDLAWLRPGDRHGDAIRWLMSRGPAILVVTHGDTTATGYTRSGSVHVRGQRVAGTDTAEWEDAFMTGLLHALNAPEPAGPQVRSQEPTVDRPRRSSRDSARRERQRGAGRHARRRMTLHLEVSVGPWSFCWFGDAEGRRLMRAQSCASRTVNKRSLPAAPEGLEIDDRTAY